MKRIGRNEERFLRILLYGRPGSLKTRTAATAAWDPRTAPVLHVDMGGNTLSTDDYAERPDIVKLDEMKELNIIYDYLFKGQKPEHVLARSMELRGDYKTIVIDGVTDVQRRSLQIVSGNRDLMPGDIPVSMQIQHYMPSLAQMTNLAFKFYGLPMHVIITALERSDQDAFGNVTVRPLLAGQAATEVAGYAYNVGRMTHIERAGATTKKDIERDKSALGGEKPQSVVFFQPTLFMEAKDQHGIGVPYMVNPTITKMLDLIEKHRAAREAGTEMTTKENFDTKSG